MNHANSDQAPASIDLSDILFALRRRKWMVVLLALLGFTAAALFYLFSPRTYQSETRLLVKYVVDRSAVDPVDSQTETTGRYSDTIIGTEVSLLTSWDLATQVADTLGADRILAGESGERTRNRAAAAVLGGLDVKSVKGSNVISVTYRDDQRALPQPVLEEFVRRYLTKHLEVHRNMGAFDFVSQQRDLVRARIVDLDAKIKALKEQAGIASGADSDANVLAQITSARQGLVVAQSEMEEHAARVKFLTSRPGAAPAAGSPAAPGASSAVSATAPGAVVQQYQALVEQLNFNHKTEAELLVRYTPESAEVRTTRARIRDLDDRRAKLEASYPSLTSVAVAGKAGAENRSVDLLSEQAQLAASEAKTASLKTQLGELQAAAARISAVSSQLEDLESQRQVEQKNYVDFQTKLARSSIDEALDSSKIPNISVLQRPSPAALMMTKTMKAAGGLAVGGLGLGLALAVGLGLLDRTVKRPRELEARLGIPMLVNIPRLRPGARQQLEGRRGDESASRELAAPGGNGHANGKSHGALAPWDAGHFVRPYAEAIRNRLILGFELKKVSHKPKLIGVTGLSGGEGSSTLAGGLAASLSETGDGKVLLVDMNADNPEMRPFIEGDASGTLLEALRTKDQAPSVGDNLFLASGKSDEKRGALTIAPKRFYDLMPTLRASDFDYIIFDLPPLDQSGATLAVSGSLDKVLLMVESEKNDRDELKRAYDELVAAKADVSAVLNKSDSKMPK